MYIRTEFLKTALEGLNRGGFPSNAHKTVAENSLLCNPKIFTMDDLIGAVDIVCKIPRNKISKVTFKDLDDMGIPLGQF